jgi:hypothetical protein
LIVITVIVVTLSMSTGFLRDTASPGILTTVTLIVIEESAWISGFLATMTVVTLVTVVCGRFLAGVPH